jgi:hypothetical protein
MKVSNGRPLVWPAITKGEPLKKIGAQPTLLRWLLVGGAFLTLTGYLGPWVDHPVAGLVILGLDMGEYVKFLPTVRTGETSIWREGFYLPLVAVSLNLSFYCFDRQLDYPWWVRAILLAVAGVAALNLLPPAWTPARLLTPEFQMQTSALLLCLAAIGFSPLLALLPRWLTSVIGCLLCLTAIWFPGRDFLLLLSSITELYRHPLIAGWGIIVMAGGLLLLGSASVASVAAIQAAPFRGRFTEQSLL